MFDRALMNLEDKQGFLADPFQFVSRIDEYNKARAATSLCLGGRFGRCWAVGAASCFFSTMRRYGISAVVNTAQNPRG